MTAKAALQAHEMLMDMPELSLGKVINAIRETNISPSTCSLLNN